MKLKSVFLAILISAVSLCVVAPVFTQDQGQVISPETRQKIDERNKEIEKRIEDGKKTITQPLPLTREDVEKKPAEAEAAAEPETAQEEAQKPKAEEPLSTQPQQRQAIPVEPEKKPVLPPRGPHPQAAAGTVSFFFDDADIFEVAQTIFADVLKVNYLIDPQVRGRVNFRTVTPIPKDEVLSVMEIIFRMNGIGFVEEGGLYRIVPLADVSKELMYSQIGKAPEKVSIEMFTFKNLDIKESMPDIENALGLHLKGGTVRIMPIFRLNALIVIASSMEQLEYMKQWIVTFDGMFAAARPKIFVYPLQNSKAEHIASLMQSILSGSASTGAIAAPKPPLTPSPPRTPQTTQTTQTTSAPRSGAVASVTGGGGGFVSPDTKIFADEITNSLIVLAIPSDYEFIKETILKIDTAPRQVIIEALIVRVELTDNLSFGFAWSLTTDVNIKGFKPFTKDINLTGDIKDNPGIVNNEKGVATIPSKGFTFIGTDPTGTVRAVITALTDESKAKVLAAPHILVADNHEARIQVGSQVPLSTSTTTTPLSGTGITDTSVLNTSTSTIQYKDIGIILKVKPQINDSGLVTIELSQEVSSMGSNVKIAGQDFASIDKEEVSSNLVARDGETIIIGGLIREDITKSKDGIPILSKIPILGHLFGNTTDNSKRSEIIILLTPRVMKSLAEVEEITSDYVDRYKSEAKDKEIDKFIEERGRKEKSGGNADKKDAK